LKRECKYRAQKNGFTIFSEQAVFYAPLFILLCGFLTNTGLEVICVRDDTEYQLAQKVSDEDLESINITNLSPFGSWDYRIFSREIVMLLFNSSYCVFKVLVRIFM
jgi:hypothetical protein